MYNKNVIGKQLITEIKMTQKPNDLTEIDMPMLDSSNDGKHLDASDPRVQAGVRKFAEYMAKKRAEKTLKSIDLPHIEDKSDIFNIPTTITDEQAQAFLNGLDKMPKIKRNELVETLTSLVVPMLDINEKDNLTKVDLPKIDATGKDAPFAKDNLTKVDLPKIDATDKDAPFAKDNLTKVDLPKIDATDKDAPFASVVQALDPNNPEVQKNIIAAAKQIALGFVALSTIIINKQSDGKQTAFASLNKIKNQR